MVKVRLRLTVRMSTVNGSQCNVITRIAAQTYVYVCVVCEQVTLQRMHTHIQTTCKRKCLTNLKHVRICAQNSDPQTSMLSHWQLWVIAPCSTPYRWTTFNYVTKCTSSPALMSPLESWTITFSWLLYKVWLLKKTYLLILWDIWDEFGVNFVLCMIRNLKIMCSKAMECLHELKGSRGAEVSFFLKKE